MKIHKIASDEDVLIEYKCPVTGVSIRAYKPYRYREIVHSYAVHAENGRYLGEESTFESACAMAKEYSPKCRIPRMGVEFKGQPITPS